jgi:hypothetical protein
MNPKQISVASHSGPGFRKDAVPDGTLTVSVNGTALLAGVIIVGEKAQLEPGGRVLFTQDRVIGCFGSPVFAFNRSE